MAVVKITKFEDGVLKTINSATDEIEFRGGKVNNDLTVEGNLIVKGSSTVLYPETVNIADNHLFINAGYENLAAQAGGIVVNYEPTALARYVASGGFTAGSAGISNAAVAVSSAGSSFSAGDIIQVSGAANELNNGIFEVYSHASDVLTIRGIGLYSCEEGFTQNQFVTDSTEQGLITKVNVAVLQASVTGDWQYAKGSSTPFTFVGLTGGSLLASNNLSDLDDAATARTNLGLGSAAESAASDFLAVSSNLSDLADASTARTNLGLGSAAQSAASDFLAVSSNLSDLADASTARTNLGLGSAAVESVGTSAGNVVQLDGSARLPAVDGSQLTNLPVYIDGTIGANEIAFGTSADTIGGSSNLSWNDGTSTLEVTGSTSLTGASDITNVLSTSTGKIAFESSVAGDGIFVDPFNVAINVKAPSVGPVQAVVDAGQFSVTEYTDNTYATAVKYVTAIPGELSIMGDAADCLTISSAIDGQFLAVSPTMYSVTITDPLNTDNTLTLGPSDVAVGDGTQSGNVYAGEVAVHHNASTNKLSLSVPAGLATLTSEDSSDVPQALNIVCEELQLNGSTGSAGYVLVSGGSGAAPSWATTAWVDGADVSLTDTSKKVSVGSGGLAVSQGASIATSGWTTTGCATGEIVYASGVSTVSLADADNSSASKIIGVVADSGEIVHIGPCDFHVNAGGCSAGDRLYASATAGRVTATPPSTAGQYVAPVGIALESIAANGTGRGLFMREPAVLLS